MRTTSRLSLGLFSLLALSLSACGDDTTPQNPDETFTATIAFEGRSGDAAFTLGDTLSGLDANGDTLRVYDLRFYLSDIEAVDDAGLAHPLVLESSPWNADGRLALIDLSDVSDEGASTAGVRNYLRGTLPEGTYVALRFTLGVPFELNHSEFASAPAPLNMGSMAWSWRGGRIFFRMDALTGAGNGAHIHLGSTGCQGEIDAITHCDQPNRPRYEIPWTAGQNIALDIRALYDGLDLNTNQEDTGALCMSAPDDLDCAPFFDAFGVSEAPEEGAFHRSSIFAATDATIAPRSSDLDVTPGEHTGH